MKIEQFCGYMAVYWLLTGHGKDGLKFTDFDAGTRLDAARTLRGWWGLGIAGQTQYACDRLGGRELPKKRVDNDVRKDTLPVGSMVCFGNNDHTEAAVKIGKNAFRGYNWQQRLVDDHNPLTLHAIIGEAALRRVVGGPEVMVEQLRHLLDRAAAPNITAQVLPYRSGAYGVMTSAITILGFADPSDPDCVYSEYHGGGRWIEDEGTVTHYVAEFEALTAVALPTEESAALVREVATEME
jgi:hypothetical protein